VRADDSASYNFNGGADHDRADVNSRDRQT
jgi:hypothetical protein